MEGRAAAGSALADDRPAVRQDDRALGMAYWTLAWIDIQDHRFADAIANAQRCRKTAATPFDRNAGEMASAGAPLLTVVDISRVVARTNVPLEQAGYVKTGAPATIMPADGSPPVSGTVTVVSPAADPGSTTVQVWVQADNPGERLKPGTAVRVSIVSATLPDAVVVPVAALLPSSEGVAVVSVGADMVAHQKAVKTGVRDGDKVQIVDGVSAGERLVIVGGVGLEDGAKVKIEKPAEKAEEK